MSTGTNWNIVQIYNKRTFKMVMGFFYRHIPSRLLDHLNMNMKLCFWFDSASNLFNGNCHQEGSVPSHYRCLSSPLAQESLWTLMLTRKYSETPSLLRKVVLLDGFLCCKFCCDIAHKALHSFFLLTLIEQILITNCSFLH